MKFISCLGHIRALREKRRCVFAVWAPRAKRVSVVGDFNGWNPEADEMKCDNDMGIYQLFIPGVKNGDLYKYCITTYDDRLLYKADPYGNYAEMRPGNASRVTDLAKPFKWGDAAWLKNVWSLILERMPCLFMRCIQAPGRDILPMERMTRDSTITGNWLMLWQDM